MRQALREIIALMPELMAHSAYKFGVHDGKTVAGTASLKGNFTFTPIGLERAKNNLNNEVDELMEAIRDGKSHEEIMDECADVVGQALIIYWHHHRG